MDEEGEAALKTNHTVKKTSTVTKWIFKEELRVGFSVGVKGVMV